MKLRDAEFAKFQSKRVKDIIKDARRSHPYQELDEITDKETGKVTFRAKYKKSSVAKHAAVGGVSGLAIGSLIYKKSLLEYKTLKNKPNLSQSDKDRMEVLKKKLKTMAITSTAAGTAVGVGVGHYRQTKRV